MNRESFEIILKQYDDGFLSIIGCFENLCYIFEKEIKTIEEIDRFLKTLDKDSFKDRLYIAERLIYYRKKLNLK